MSEDEAINKVTKFVQKYREKEQKFYDYLFSMKENDIPLQAIETILAELEKKDKIINAMTKEWFELDTLFMIRGKNIHSEEELKQYFEKEVKDERKRKRSCGDDETLD